MLLSLGFVAIVAVGIIVLLAAALGIVAIVTSGREDRKTVIIVVAVSLLALFCCIAMGAIGWYLYMMPR